CDISWPTYSANDTCPDMANACTNRAFHSFGKRSTQCDGECAGKLHLHALDWYSTGGRFKEVIGFLHAHGHHPLHNCDRNSDAGGDAMMDWLQLHRASGRGSI